MVHSLYGNPDITPAQAAEGQAVWQKGFTSMWKVWSLGLGLLLAAIFLYVGTLASGLLALAALLIFAPVFVFAIKLLVSVLDWWKLL